MVFLDVNVLIYAFRADSAHFAIARRRLDEYASEGVALAVHPQSWASLIRITTNPRAFAQPSSIEECQQFIDAFESMPNIQGVRESSSFLALFLDLLRRYKVTGPEVTDYYWAALAIDNGASFCSADKKFAAVRELRWENLLA